LTAPPSAAHRAPDGPAKHSAPAQLEPHRLLDHIDALYRAARALSRSQQDAEDLVQETFARVLKRPRFVRRGHERGYLLRALRNTYNSEYRATRRRPATVTLADEIEAPVPEAGLGARQIMEAVASAPTQYRDAMIAVDLMGMSYKEAARALHAREATITTRLYRGRQHVAGVLKDAAGAA
jgi:RNA polymerase sigma-70 factor (ECF subfamily)